MKHLLRAGAVALALFALPAIAFAQTTSDTTVNFGAVISDLINLYIPIIGTVVAAVIGWAAKRFLNIQIEADALTKIETFATNAAGDFIRQHTADALDKMTIDVGNKDIAALASSGFARIPDALKYFGWGPEQVKQRIVEKIGVLSAGAAPSVTPIAEPGVIVARPT